MSNNITDAIKRAETRIINILPTNKINVFNNHSNNIEFDSVLKAINRDFKFIRKQGVKLNNLFDLIQKLRIEYRTDIPVKNKEILDEYLSNINEMLS